MNYTYNSTNRTNKSIVSDEVNDNMFFIRVEMVDGSSQTLQISKEQADDLGIDLTNGISGIETVPQNDFRGENAKEVVIDGERFLEEDKMIIDNGKVTEYRVLHPLELNLKKPLKKRDFLPNRGRFKRTIDDIITLSPSKRSKTVRTRSGRITAPPKHIQQIYKRFLESNKSKNTETTELTRPHSPILIGDFTPLRTNGTPNPTQTPITSTTNKNRRSKSLLASQFRCTTCNKAYIGKRKMLAHLSTFPSHTPTRKLDGADTKTWACLIDTSKGARQGKRGAKFCRELLNLLTNARILVRYFFKKLGSCNSDVGDRGDDETDAYLISGLLAEALGVDKGWYAFNENELCKDVSIFSFLENFDSDVLSALSINDNKTNKQTKNYHGNAKETINQPYKDNKSTTVNEMQQYNLKNTQTSQDLTDYYEQIILNNDINPPIRNGEDINKNSADFDAKNSLEGVGGLKYRLGELVVDSLDIPPLEIFQFDSNQ